MKAFTKAILGAGAGLALTSGAVTAAVVCNEDGDCWKTTETRVYEPTLKLRVQPDDWRWKEGEKYRWREPGRGHGYYRQGVWVEIK